jgi:GTP-binding protein EngB required for normal cell division
VAVQQAAGYARAVRDQNRALTCRGCTLAGSAAEGLAVKSSAAANGPYLTSVGGHVRGTGPYGSLISALDRLDALADGAGRESLAGLRDRLQTGRLRVLVAGEAKRGKSTLVNALLGREILPTGVTPLTSVATTVTYGTQELARVTFLDGRTATCAFAELDDVVTERGNPGNRRGVAGVTVEVDAPILARGMDLVDTPGTGSVHEHNTASADIALPTMDAAVFVLTADPPVSASERDLLSRVASLSVSRFVVLNKADYLDDPGLAEALDFTGRVVAQATGEPTKVYALSARSVLAGADDAGFEAFATDFRGYLESGRADDLERSVAAHLRRLTGSLLDEVTLARRAARMREGTAAERVAAFTGRLRAVQERGQEAEDVAAAESRRMLAELNEAAESEIARLAANLTSEVGRMLEGDLKEAAAAEIERLGRARLADKTRDAVETWRQAERDRLERRLEGLEARLASDLNAELDAVRGAAADLLGLDLAVPSLGQRLSGDLRLFYGMQEDIGQTELLAGAIRRRLPGQAGRRRARHYLEREARDLADSKVGRARADLQYRLAEATRALSRAMRVRYAEGTGRLETALETAAQLRKATAGEAAQRDRQLAGREDALRVLAESLESDSEGKQDHQAGVAGALPLR